MLLLFGGFIAPLTAKYTPELIEALAPGGSDFSQNIYQKTNSRIVFLALTYNFGEQFNTKSKRTQMRKQREMEGEIQQSGN